MISGWAKLFSFYYQAKQQFAGFIFILASDLYYKVYLAAIILVNLVTWIFAFIIRSKATVSTLILHYNVDFGIDYIAETWRIFLLPVSGLVINLTNILLVVLLYRYRQEKLIFHLIFAGALMANLTILAALETVYLINFR